jgi:hypothetical protein
VRTRVAIAGLAASVLFAAMACSASALKLGTTTIPSGGSAAGCSGSGSLFLQAATDPSYQYSIPSGGGQIGSWSINTVSAAPGTPLTFLVLRPSGGGYKVAALDSETVPTPLPVSGIATFNLSTPITVSEGELLGLYGSVGTVACYFSGGTIPAAEVIGATIPAAAPSVGFAYTPSVAAQAILVNVAAELAQSLEVGITGSATPATITAGGVSEFAFKVSNGGISSAPVTFTDGVPSGLTILSAVAGSGICATAGQTVSCTIPNLEGGQSVPVSIIVAAPNAGGYSDTATVSTTSALIDVNPANNTLGATLNVNVPALAPVSPVVPAVQCKVVQLAGAPLAVAKLVIPALNCKVGKVTSKASKGVRKGYVISTTPRSGATLAAGSAVDVVTSSGPPKKRKKKH